jgi:hypothetical protein
MGLAPPRPPTQQPAHGNGTPCAAEHTVIPSVTIRSRFECRIITPNQSIKYFAQLHYASREKRRMLTRCSIDSTWGVIAYQHVGIASKLASAARLSFVTTCARPSRHQRAEHAQERAKEAYERADTTTMSSDCISPEFTMSRSPSLRLPRHWAFGE